MSLNDYSYTHCLWDDPCDDCSHWFGMGIEESILLASYDVWDAWMYYH